MRAYVKTAPIGAPKGMGVTDMGGADTEAMMMGAVRSASQSAALTGTATLSSGRRVSIRPVRFQDEALARAFLRGLSPASRYNRFMTAVDDVPKGWLEQFRQSTSSTHFSLLASTQQDGTEIMIGEAQYGVAPCGASAELALVVADGWQNDGLGYNLINCLEATAANAGIMRLAGDILGANYAMRRLFHKAGFRITELNASCLRFEKGLQGIRTCRCA